MISKFEQMLFMCLIAFLALLASCQRVITVDIGNAPQPLVIEGNLTNQKGAQTVSISQSVVYSSASVFPAVSGATVTITDAIGTVNPLTETSAGTYTINNYKGNPLNLYMLTVKVNGQTYSGGSVMPFPVNLDSLTVMGQVFGNKTVKTVVVNFHDPAGVPNQYRYVMYINGVQVKRIFTEDDHLSDGRVVATPLYQDITLNKGDKVDVDMQCIDAAIYNYWFSLSNQGGNTPRDSATPANPPSNLSNNTLGYFSAHTTQRKSIIIP